VHGSCGTLSFLLSFSNDINIIKVNNVFACSRCAFI
jgi:hypothetical protein